MNHKKYGLLAAIGLGLVLICQPLFAATSSAALDSQDPYENYNRHAFKMNDTLDKVILKPVALAYNTILPPPATKGIRNFFDNLTQIPTIINDLLQGKFLHATADTWRFAINSTIGIGGLFDVASHMGLAPHSEDFGLTLAHWGYKSSTYFIIPLLGPSTIRDTFALYPNYWAFTVYPHIKPWQSRYTFLALNGVSQRAQFLKFQGVVEAASVDPYVFQRNAYLQYRAAQIAASNSGLANPSEELPSSDSTDSYVMP